MNTMGESHARGIGEKDIRREDTGKLRTPPGSVQRKDKFGLNIDMGKNLFFLLDDPSFHAFYLFGYLF